MAGFRKLAAYAVTLAFFAGLAAFAVWGSLSEANVTTLATAAGAAFGLFVGGNYGEHVARRGTKPDASGQVGTAG